MINRSELIALREVSNKAEVLLDKLSQWCLLQDEPLATKTALAFGIEAEALMTALEQLAQAQQE